MLEFHEEKQRQRLANIRKKEQEELAQLLAHKRGLEYADLSRVSINNEALAALPEEQAREARVATFNAVGKKLQIGVLSPDTEATDAVLEDLRRRGYELYVYVVSAQSLERVWKRYADIHEGAETQAGVFTISYDEITRLSKEVRNLEDVKRLVEGIMAERKSHRTSRILEVMIAGALALLASDVHVEPEEDYVRLRYRLDGILTDITTFDHRIYKLLSSRIKLLSGMLLNVTSQAQDGRFSVRIDTNDIEIRSSVLPGTHGESIVLRVLNPKTITLSLTELGMDPHLLDVVAHEIRKPHGMIFNTGPTGSGKTTSLYSFLTTIHTPEVKIITIEDPVEYLLPGIVQTQVKEGYTFASGLRSALRQDPDVIMVGEVRDGETADTAINASLTGHLVFSTLHTNTAAGTFPRLIELGVNARIISSAVNLALAQRLVRKLCGACRKEMPLLPMETARLRGVLARVEREGFEMPQLTRHFEPVGCPECNGIGYKGRIGVFEAIVVDEKIDSIIRSEPSEAEIAHTARSQGILTMQQDGIVKALTGVTSLKELVRVTGIDEDVVYSDQKAPIETPPSNTNR